MQQTNLQRRNFLQTTAIAGTSVLISQGKRASANERLRLGVIGCGGRGTWHINDLNRRIDEGTPVEIAAVCDIYENRKNHAKHLSGGKLYHDYRDLLEHENLDAVVIASPDHWHCQMALDSMDAGLDLYLEKPMTLYAHEAKQVYEKSVESKRIIQVGNGGASDDLAWQARKAIDEGLIGKLIWSQASAARNSRGGEWNWRIHPEANPQNVDWKAFLGPAPDRPWDPDRYFRFRKYWDYSGGIATDLFYHGLGHLSIALKAEFPQRVSGMGGIWAQPWKREVPDTFMMVADYPSQHTVTMLSSMANDQGCPVMIRGQKGTIYFPSGSERRRQREEKGREWLTVKGESAFMDDFKDMSGGKSEVHLMEEDRDDHMNNFLRCVKERTQPHMNALRGYKVTVAISMSVYSYRQQKMVFFDEKNEQVCETPVA